MSSDRIIVPVLPGIPVSRKGRSDIIARLIGRYPILPQTLYEWTELPSGWIALVAALGHRADVLRVQPPAAQEFFFQGFSEADGRLCIRAESPNRVLQGLMRKYCAMSTFTCYRCGAPGKPYEVKDSERRPLCALCAAPFVLARDLERLTRVRVAASGKNPRIEFERIPGSLRPTFVAWLANRPLVRSTQGNPLGAFPWDFYEWTANLDTLKARAEALANERRSVL